MVTTVANHFQTQYEILMSLSHRPETESTTKQRMSLSESLFVVRKTKTTDSRNIFRDRQQTHKTTYDACERNKTLRCSGMANISFRPASLYCAPGTPCVGGPQLAYVLAQCAVVDLRRAPNHQPPQLLHIVHQAREHWHRLNNALFCA